MKSGSLPKGFPASQEEWDKLIAEAPGEDRPPTPEEEAAWSNAIVSRSLPELREKLARRQRGPNKRPLKQQVAVRYSPEVIAYFRATGPGWQTRMDEALKEWIRGRAA